MKFHLPCVECLKEYEIFDLNDNKEFSRTDIQVV